MKNILMLAGAGANHHIRMSLCNSMRAAGYNVYYWNSEGKSAFDVFYEFPPDVFFGDTWQLSRAIVKNLNERPEIKIVLWSDAWGDIVNDIDLQKYPVGVATDDHRKLVDQLHNKPFLITNHSPEWIEYTHGWWSKLGCDVESILTSADITTFYPRPQNEFYKTNLFFCGGMWGYKGRNLNKYITPFTYPNTKWKIRIAGGGWSVVNSIGIISDEETARHYTNSDIVLHVVEPHASDPEGYGDIPLRYFQVPACGGFAISCPCNGIREIFSEDELVVSGDPQDFFEKVVYFLNNPQDVFAYRKKSMIKVLQLHTGFDRCVKLFDLLSEPIDQLKRTKDLFVERIINESTP